MQAQVMVPPIPPATSAMAERGERRNRFFVGMSLVLLIVVLAGFSPTLYLRPFFDVSPIPAYLYAHGAVLTAWFVWLFGQSYLVGVRRIDLHRTFGTAGAMLAAMVVVAGLMAQFDKAPRLSALGLDMDSRLGADSAIFWTNIATLMAFSSFVAVAIVFRRRADVHKRLMLLASLAIIGPAVGRISRWPIFGWGDLNTYAPVLERTLPIGVLILGMLAVVAYDLVSSRRLHGATLIACATVAALRITAGLIASSEFGMEFVRGMSRAASG